MPSFIMFYLNTECIHKCIRFLYFVYVYRFVATCYKLEERTNCSNLLQIERKEIMANNDNVITIRLNEDILNKLNTLIEGSIDESNRIGIKPQGKKEIIEEAIKTLYYKKINISQDGDVVDRINNLVDEQVAATLNSFQNKIDEILYLTIKNDLGNKLIYRSPSVIPACPDIKESIEIIVDERSAWNDALEEYMTSKWRKEKVHVHDK